MKKEDVKKGMTVRMSEDHDAFRKGDVVEVVKNDDDGTVLLRGMVINEAWAMPRKIEPVQPKGLKRTEIDIIPLSGGKEVEVVAIRHVAWMKEIAKQYGEAVRDKYFRGFPRYGNSSRRKPRIIVRSKTGADNTQFLIVGRTYSQKHFDYIVDTMKAAGDRLGKIIREDRERKKREEEEAQAKAVKTIKI
jgi:hypothetical protein